MSSYLRPLRADAPSRATRVRRPATAWPSRLLAKLYWTVKSDRDGVQEREQLQPATLDAAPSWATRTSMPPIATAIRREVRPARESR